MIRKSLCLVAILAFFSSVSGYDVPRAFENFGTRNISSQQLRIGDRVKGDFVGLSRALYRSGIPNQIVIHEEVFSVDSKYKITQVEAYTREVSANAGNVTYLDGGPGGHEVRLKFTSGRGYAINWTVNLYVAMANGSRPGPTQPAGPANETIITKRLVLGSRKKGDRLDLTKTVQIPAEWNNIRIHDEIISITNKSRNITQVDAYTLEPYDFAANVTLISGGVGGQEVQLRFTSHRGYGINYIVKVYSNGVNPSAVNLYVYAFSFLVATFYTFRSARL